MDEARQSGGDAPRDEAASAGQRADRPDPLSDWSTADAGWPSDDGEWDRRTVWSEPAWRTSEPAWATADDVPSPSDQPPGVPQRGIGRRGPDTDERLDVLDAADPRERADGGEPVGGRDPLDVRPPGRSDQLPTDPSWNDLSARYPEVSPQVPDRPEAWERYSRNGSTYSPDQQTIRPSRRSPEPVSPPGWRGSGFERSTLDRLVDDPAATPPVIPLPRSAPPADWPSVGRSDPHTAFDREAASREYGGAAGQQPLPPVASARQPSAPPRRNVPFGRAAVPVRDSDGGSSPRPPAQLDGEGIAGPPRHVPPAFPDGDRSAPSSVPSASPAPAPAPRLTSAEQTGVDDTEAEASAMRVRDADETEPASGTLPAHPARPPAQPVGAPAGTADTEVLPQRIPAEPDVPTVPEPTVDPPAETPELARIATHLRRSDSPLPQERPEGFDVNAILTAVREVPGVADASLRTTPAGAHKLRLDLADGADSAEVSRQVARLLQERMGLAAAPPDAEGAESSATALPAPAPTPYDGEAGEPFVPRRRRTGTVRGRAAVIEQPAEGLPGGGVTAEDGPVMADYAGAHLARAESAPSRPLRPGTRPGPRVVIDHFQVSTSGLTASVDVRLTAGGRIATGVASGPSVDGYVLRLCATATAAAVDDFLRTASSMTERGRCFVEHAAVVSLGNCEVATVVVLLVCDGWVEQLAGSVVVSGDPRGAVVRATLAAINRRLEALLS